MNTNESTRVQSVTYSTATGEMTVTYDRPEWVVVDNGTEHRFAKVTDWLAYARQTHGWPLAVKTVV